MREFCETLYCAFAPLDAFSISADGRIQFFAQVTSGGVQSEHRAEFIGVRGLSRHRDAPYQLQDGDVLELSVVELEREAGKWRVWFNPWYLEEIQFHCERIFLDGLEVTGTGRWLHDELPRRGAL